MFARDRRRLNLMAPSSCVFESSLLQTTPPVLSTRIIKRSAPTATSHPSAAPLRQAGPSTPHYLLLLPGLTLELPAAIVSAPPQTDPAAASSPPVLPSNSLLCPPGHGERRALFSRAAEGAGRAVGG